MKRIQENKLKNRVKGDHELSTHKSARAERHHFQTSTSNYLIKVNQPKQDLQPQVDKHQVKNNKKVKFLTQEIQKSHCLHTARSLGARKELILKVSTLNNLEDLNIYQKCKSSKRGHKGVGKDRNEEKIRQNVKTANSNGNIKMRGVKSNSKSHKQLTLKCLQPKSISKSKSFTKLRQKSRRESDDITKKNHYQSPQMVDIQSSYYFSNYDSKNPSSVNEDKGEMKTKESSEVPNRKKGMYLFQSKEEEWREPRIMLKNLERTVDPFNW